MQLLNLLKSIIKARRKSNYQVFRNQQVVHGLFHAHMKGDINQIRIKKTL